MAKPKFEKGDVVIYSRSFLRSIGAKDAQTANREATVESSQIYPGMKYDIVTVTWSDTKEQSGCLSCNLVKKDKKHLEPV